MQRQKITLTAALYQSLLELKPNTGAEIDVINAMCAWAYENLPKKRLIRIINHRIILPKTGNKELYPDYILGTPNSTIRSILAHQLPLAHQNGVQSVLNLYDYYRYFTPAYVENRLQIRIDVALIEWLKSKQLSEKMTINELIEGYILRWHAAIPTQDDSRLPKKTRSIGRLSGAITYWLEQNSLEKLDNATINRILTAYFLQEGEAAKQGELSR